jgi:AraC family transcriptional regulator of adaptative response/methylated-DNA-[protein]-cysteine methyltransferase
VNAETGSRTFATRAAKWRALAHRDAAADGCFVYAVATTRVYCRPSCPARKPKPENATFFATPAAAAAAGFRACRRCRPDAVQALDERGSRARAIARACRAIDAAETPPDLDRLAASVGMSRSHFQRTFKTVTGLTPRTYAAAARGERARALLRAQSPVTEAVYAAGFGSSGRFYEAAPAHLGMSPSQFRTGGRGVAIAFAVGQCSLGAILVAASAKGVCAILLGDDPRSLVHDLEARFPSARLSAGDAEFRRWVARVVGFVEAPRLGLDLPLDLRGTAFQRRVWRALSRIPPGTTASYGEIARRIGAPTAARAVARACADNPLAVAIPCHRVVRSTGDVSGYRWGVARKRALLAREAATT